MTAENEFEVIKERELGTDENPYEQLMQFLDQESNFDQIPELQKGQKIEMSWPLISV